MIGDARRAVAAALDGLGVAVYAYLPPAAVPPLAAVVPGPVYVQLRGLRGDAAIGVEVLLVAALHNPAPLDDMIDAALAALNGAGFQTADVSAPDADMEASTLTARIPVIARWKE